MPLFSYSFLKRYRGTVPIFVKRKFLFSTDPDPDLDPAPDLNWAKFIDPDPNSMNLDPKHWVPYRCKCGIHNDFDCKSLHNDFVKANKKYHTKTRILCPPVYLAYP